MGDAQAFRQDWEANGPMAPGLDPMDAVDRLKKFQQMFEVSFAAPSGPACCCREVPRSDIERRCQCRLLRLAALLAAACSDNSSSGLQ